MSWGNWFWILFVLTVLSGLGWNFLPAERRAYLGAGFGLMILLLLGILGWQVFGAVAK